jgi:hypothetical protein
LMTTLGPTEAVNTVRIRAACASDLPALRDLFRRSSPSYEGDRDLLLARPEVLELADDGITERRTPVAVGAGDEIRGFITSRPLDASGVEIEDLFVDPDWMRTGVAQARSAGPRSSTVAGGSLGLRRGRPVTVLRLRRQWLRHRADVPRGRRPYRGSPWKLTLTRPCPPRRARTPGSSAIFAPTTSAGPSARSCSALCRGRDSSAPVRSRFGPGCVAPTDPAARRCGVGTGVRE